MTAKEKFHHALLQLNELVIQNENNPALHELDFDLMRDELKKIYSALNEWQLANSSGMIPVAEKKDVQQFSESKQTEARNIPREETTSQKENIPVYSLSSQQEQKNDLPPSPKKTVSELIAEKTPPVSTINDKFNSAKPEIGDRVKSAPIKDLRTYIGLNRRAFFADAFFKGDKTKMDELIEHVSYMKTLEEAVLFVRSAADFSHVSATDAWREFTQLLQRRFALAH